MGWFSKKPEAPVEVPEHKLSLSEFAIKYAGEKNKPVTTIESELIELLIHGVKSQLQPSELASLQHLEVKDRYTFLSQTVEPRFLDAMKESVIKNYRRLYK